MTPFSETLVKFGPMLLIGSTMLLGIGCLAIRLTLSPVHRQRLGETTVAAVLVWMVLAVLPLPRLLPQSLWMMNTNEAGKIGQSSDRTVAFSPDGKHSRQIANDLSVASHAASTDLLTHLDLSPPEVRDDESWPTVQGNDHRSDELVNLVTERTSRPPLMSIFWTQCGPIGATLYLAGALACWTWLAFGHLLLIGIRMRGRAPEPWLRELYERLTQGAAPAHTRLLISTACRRPISWGAIWPVVVLPADLCRQQNEDQLRIILLHELGHVAQGDAWGNLLLTMAFPVLYVQPLYWWLRSQVRLAAELVADECAARQVGKECYASELIALAKLATSGRTFWGVTGVVSSPSLFYRRMEMLIARETPLVDRPSPSWRLASLTVAGLTVALAAALLGIHSAQGQQRPPENPTAVLDIDRDTSSQNAPTKNDPQDDPILSERSLEEPDGELSSPPPVVDAVVAPGKPPVAAVAPIVQNDPPSDPPKQESPPPAAKLAKPTPPTPPGLDARDPLIADPSSEQSTGAKEQKHDLFMIHSTNDGEVEVIFESDGEKTRMTAKQFIIQGNRIRAAGVGAVDMSRKNAATLDKPSSNNWATKIEPKAAIKLQSADKEGVHDYRVLKNDDGSLSLEIWKTVDGQSPKQMGRVGLPPELTGQLLARLSESPKREPDRKIFDRNKGSAADPAPRSTVQSSTSNRIELITLATTYADALSAVESSSDAVTQQRADRKAKLLRRMIDVQRRAVIEECDRMEQLYKAGTVSFRELADSKTRRAMLDEILELDPGAATVPATPKSDLGVGGKITPPKEAPETTQPQKF